jgi:hypothetical protein
MGMSSNTSTTPSVPRSRKRVFTRDFRGDEPESYVTTYRYNLDKELIQTVYPDGQIVDHTYSNSSDRAAQGNLTHAVFSRRFRSRRRSDDDQDRDRLRTDLPTTGV